MPSAQARAAVNCDSLFNSGLGSAEELFEASKWVWMDGQIVQWEEATIHVSAHALHYGTGVFEDIRCYDTGVEPAIFRLDAHLERFYASGSVYGLRVPFDRAELRSAICDLIRRNQFRNCYIRPLCHFGSKSLGLLPDNCPIHTSILVWPWKSYLSSAALAAGISVGLSSWTKFDGRTMPPAAKACGQYLNSILALREAVHGGFEEALLLDQHGSICEGSGENVFLIKNGILLTNDERQPILPGITRDSIIQIAHDLGISVELRPLTIRDLLIADEVFLAGTAAEILPVRSIEGKCVSGGTRGPMTEALQRKFFAVVTGQEQTYRQWLHFIPQSVDEQDKSTLDVEYH